MTLLEEMIENKGLKQTWIAKEIGISTRQLSNWLKYENLNQVTKFFKLLEILNISLVEIGEDMEKNKAI